MGSGIADVSINKEKYHVLLKDRTLEDATRGEKAVWDELQKKTKKRILSPFQRDQIFSWLTGTESYQAFSKTDIVIDAVFED